MSANEANLAFVADQLFADSPNMTDEEISTYLDEAGIDMQPAFDRLRKMIAPHRATHFLKRLATERGSIVSSADCSPMELAFAEKEGRFFVDDEGFGYVMRMKEWRELAERSIGGKLAIVKAKGTP